MPEKQQSPLLSSTESRGANPAGNVFSQRFPYSSFKTSCSAAKITGGTGFDDVFCYAPVAPVVELSSAVLGRDGCLNFFAGPTDNQFSAKLNFYDVHYNSTHVMGTTGGNTADMIESLELTAAKRINPAVMSICGIQGIQEMEQVNFDQMFLGVTSYFDGVGFSCGVAEEAALKRTVMGRSEQVIVLMDSSKVGLKSTYTICGLKDVDGVVSDGQLPDSFLEECEKFGVSVY